MSPTRLELVQNPDESEDRVTFYTYKDMYISQGLSGIHSAINNFSRGKGPFEEEYYEFLKNLYINHVKGIEILQTTDNKNFVMALLCFPIKADISKRDYHFSEKDTPEGENDHYQSFLAKFNSDRDRGNPFETFSTTEEMVCGYKGRFLNIPVLIDYSNNKELERFSQHLIRTKDYIFYSGTAEDVGKSGVDIFREY